jgi:uncharacterized membrane-anchored protein YitT (DUF2179 family)
MKSIIKRGIVIIFYAVLAAIGVNMFLAPSNIFSGGVTGLSQLLSSIGLDFLNVNISIAAWVLILNLPLAVLSWLKLGKKFTLYTILAVVSSSFFMKIIPVVEITQNQILASIFGGVLTGAGVGLCLREGFSTGGTDILMLVIQKLTGKSVGQVGLILNGAIILAAGLVYGWEQSLYSLIAIYATTQVMDMFFIQQHKLTVTIYTKKGEEVAKNLLANNLRGVTIGKGFLGGYTKEELQSVITVISKHELLFIKKAVAEVDQDAFVNVQPTVDVIGNFLDKSLLD